MAEATKETLEYYNKRFGETIAQALPVKEHDKVRWKVIEDRVSKILSGFAGTPSILDFGCGNGWLAALLTSFGKVTGVDVADKAIATASERFPNVEFICLNAEMNDKDPFFERKFDLVISSEVIEHIHEQKQYISNMMATLKPGGKFIITTPNGRWHEAWFAGERFSYQQPVENWLTADQLTSLLQPYASIDFSGSFYAQWLYYYPNKIMTSHFLGRVSMKAMKIVNSFGRHLDKMDREGKGLYLILTGTKN